VRRPARTPWVAALAVLVSAAAVAAAPAESGAETHNVLLTKE
jgi:hypothetical protein